MRPLNGRFASSRAQRVIVVLLAACAIWPLATSPCHGEPSSAPGRVIQLLIQTDPNMKVEEIKDKFTTARNNTTDCNFRELRVDPVEEEAYVLLSSLVRTGAIKAASIKDDPSGVLIEPIKGQDGAWWVNLRDPARFLESAVVTSLDAATGKEESVELEVAPRTQDKAALRFHSPGAYVLRLEKGNHPRSATLRVTTENAAGNLSKPEDVTVGWPDVGRCYLVTLEGVVGDEQRLFESLKDPDKVANPIKELYDSTTTLIVGSFLEKDPWLRPGFVSVTYLKPANTEPRRLWMRLPLTEVEERAVCADLDARLAPEDGFKKLPAWLDTQRLQKGQKLVPGIDRWIEIRRDPVRGFEIDIPIDTRSWKSLLATSPDRVGDRVVLVWEFADPRNPEDRSIIRVGGPNGKRYQSERLGWWLTGLPTAPNEEQ